MYALHQAKNKSISLYAAKGFVKRGEEADDSGFDDLEGLPASLNISLKSSWWSTIWSLRGEALLWATSGQPESTATRDIDLFKEIYTFTRPEVRVSRVSGASDEDEEYEDDEECFQSCGRGDRTMNLPPRALGWWCKAERASK
jgi:hypothetical protein